MNKLSIILSATLFCSIFSASAQDNKNEAEVVKTKKNIFTVNSQYKKPSKDYVMLQAGFTSWLIPTTSNAVVRQRGHELGAYICYDLPFANLNYSFAPGIGISSSNIYLKDQYISLTDTSAQVYFKSDSGLDYKRFKYSLNYLEAPFEFRYFGNKYNRNRGFKASIGVRVGALIQAHTKGVRGSSAGNLKEKTISRRFNETWRITPTVRLGWGNFSVYGSYQITEVFKAGNTSGLGIRPWSVGLCISGL
jgi:hypothetical protein